MVTRAADQGPDRCRCRDLGSLRGLPGHALNTEPWRSALELGLFALGLGFAIWARLHIGRNWGTPMTQKDEPELVTHPRNAVNSGLPTGPRAERHDVDGDA